MGSSWSWNLRRARCQQVAHAQHRIFGVHNTPKVGDVPFQKALDGAKLNERHYFPSKFSFQSFHIDEYYQMQSERFQNRSVHPAIPQFDSLLGEVFQCKDAAFLKALQRWLKAKKESGELYASQALLDLNEFVDLGIQMGMLEKKLPVAGDGVRTDSSVAVTCSKTQSQSDPSIDIHAVPINLWECLSNINDALSTELDWIDFLECLHTSADIEPLIVEKYREVNGSIDPSHSCTLYPTHANGESRSPAGSVSRGASIRGDKNELSNVHLLDHFPSQDRHRLQRAMFSGNQSSSNDKQEMLRPRNGFSPPSSGLTCSFPSPTDADAAITGSSSAICHGSANARASGVSIHRVKSSTKTSEKEKLFTVLGSSSRRKSFPVKDACLVRIPKNRAAEVSVFQLNYKKDVGGGQNNRFICPLYRRRRLKWLERHFREEHSLNELKYDSHWLRHPDDRESFPENKGSVTIKWPHKNF